jgi:hypothetical protein
VKPPGGADPYTLGKNVFGLTPWLSTALYHLILAGRIWWPWRRFPVKPAEVAIPNLKRHLHRAEPRRIPACKGRGRLHVDRSVIEVLVVIAILVVLVTLLMPALGKARSRAVVTQCPNSLRQLQLCRQIYVNDHNDFVPPNRLVEVNGDRMAMSGAKGNE